MNRNYETLAGAAAGKPVAAPNSTIANPEQGLVQLWRCVFCAVLLLTASAWPVAEAQAGVVEQTAEEFAKKVTDDPVLQKEIGNAVEALTDTVPNAKDVIRDVKGHAVRPQRGTSGPFVELVVNFDKVACAGWLITFRKKIIDLQIARADPAKIAAAQNLYNKVVFGCRKIIDEETYSQLEKAPGTQTESEPEPEEEQDSGLGYRIRFVDGVLVLSASDAICADKCRDEWLTWKSAVRTRVGTERRITFASDRINDITKSELPGTKRRLADEKRVLKFYQDKQAKRRHGYDPKTSVEIAKSEVKISNLETRIKALEAEAKSLGDEVRALRQKMPGLLQTEKAALKAYLDCLKKCKVSADSAGDSSDFADKTIGILERRMRILDRLIKTTKAPKSTQDKRTSYLPGPAAASEHAAMIVPQGGAVVLTRDEAANRAIAISTMRQGMGFPQGSMVQPPYLGMGEDPAYEVRADIDERYRQAENHRMSTRYNEPMPVMAVPGAYGQSPEPVGYGEMTAPVSDGADALPGMVTGPQSGGLVIGMPGDPVDVQTETQPGNGYRPYEHDEHTVLREYPTAAPVLDRPVRDETMASHGSEMQSQDSGTVGSVVVGRNWPGRVVTREGTKPVYRGETAPPMEEPVTGRVVLGSGPQPAESAYPPVMQEVPTVSTAPIVVSEMPEPAYRTQPAPVSTLRVPAQPNLGYSYQPKSPAGPMAEPISQGSVIQPGYTLGLPRSNSGNANDCPDPTPHDCTPEYHRQRSM